jgi:predicted ribonuclease toxin of YeeF-YezG toxin-antitoxin module
MPTANVEVGDQVFAGEAEEAFGAVRHVAAHHLDVYVEGFGDAKIPAAAVTAVHDNKVVVDVSALPPHVQDGIARAHAAEDPVDPE